jgi:NADH-quinone oxidoreductase subunit G
MCTRCVRFTREISGSSELMVINRGSHEEIDVFPGHPLENKMSGNVVDLCPVGALGDRDFLYSQRVWFMQNHANICSGCSTGCSIHVDENQDRVYRLRPRENPHVNQWWMCDEGRYGFHHVHSEDRQTEPRYRNKDGQLEAFDWSDLPGTLDTALRGAGRLLGVLSPHLTVEDAYLLAKYLRSLDPEAVLALGPVPVVGEDETFKNGFTIRAEKCPNRRGVEKVVAHFMNGPKTLDDVLPQIASGEIQGVWVTGGYKSDDWIDEKTAERLRKASLLVVQDLFASPLWERADIQLPGAAFAEREGSYVNFDDRLQSFKWAVRPPAGVATEGRLAWRLLKMPGMYNAHPVLNEVAAEIAFFSAAVGEVPATGVDLKANLLA